MVPLVKGVTVEVVKASATSVLPGCACHLAQMRLHCAQKSICEVVGDHQ